MTSTSQNASNFPTSKKMLLDPREEVYTKQKDIRKHIEIRVSELIDKEGPNQEEYYASEDNFYQKNSPNHPNVSVKILEEYHLKQAPKQSAGATRSREKIKSSSSVGALASEPADHRVGDMFKWKERVHKKQEMQREFQEQLRSSMYDYKVFTNDLSNQMLESIRPNTRVEDILLLKGQVKQMKMKKIEEQLYGGNRVPSITKMAKRLNSSQNVYSRLYDVDKHRREKSREILMKSQNQNQTMDSIGTSTGTRHRSRSEGKRKNVLSAFMSPAHRGTQNTDFCFSPKEVTSPIAVNQTSDAHFGRDTTFSLQQTAVTSPMGTSPLYSVKNANSKNIFIQSSLNQSNEDIFSPFQPSPANHRKIAERPRSGAISIYKRLTPAPKNNMTTQSFQQSSSQNKQQKSPKNRDKSINRQQSLNHDHTEKQKRSGGMSPSESTPVLPNMIFFKNLEQRQGASTPTHENHKDNHRKNQSKGLEKNKKEPYDMRSMELFWEKILQDDSEGKGRKKSDLEGDVADRGKMWAEKKNKKLEDQRKQKEEKELENCTFKPQLQYQDQSNKNMQLYFNFLERIANTKSVSSSSNSTIGPQNPVQNYSAMKSHLTIQTGNNSGVANQGGHSGDSHENENNTRYTADPNLQKKIYNYILNIPN